MTIETKGNLRSPEEEEEKKEGAVKYDRGIKAAQGSNLYKNTSVSNRVNFDKKALNPDNLEEGGLRSQQDTNEGKQPSVSDQFFEAIGFFMPTIVGGLVGGAMEGSEGALSGAELGMKAGKQFADYKIAQQRRQERLYKLKQKSTKIDITADWVDKETGEPLYTKQKEDGSVALMRGSGEAVDPASAEMKEERINRIKQAEINSRYEGKRSETQMKFQEDYLKNFRKANEKSVTAVQENKTMQALLSQGAAITGEQIATKNARAIFDEVGRLSDEDVKRAGVPLDVAKRIKNSINEFFTGKADENLREAAIKLLKQVERQKKERLKEIINKQGNKARAKRYGLQQKDLQDYMRLELVVLDDEEEKKKSPYGDEVTRNGKTYKWNAAKGKYQLK